MNNIITITLNTAIDRVMEVDGFAIGRHTCGRLIGRVPAGKGVNVSRALAALGVPNVATGFVGREEFDLYERSLGDDGVASQFLAVEGTTRENLTVIDPSTGLETHIRDEGFDVAPADLVRLGNKLNLLAKKDDLVVISGSLPRGVDVSAVVELIDIAENKGAHVAVDGSGEMLRALRGRSMWLLKPNRDELTALAPTAIENDAALIEIGRDLSERVHFVIVSCGAAGGYLFIRGSVLIGQVDMDTTRAMSSVGCGDCMLAGFVASRKRGDDARTAYRYALAVATAAAIHTLPGRFDLALVEELLPRVSVEPV